MNSCSLENRSVLFLGGVYPRAGVDLAPVDLERYGAGDQAANAYQWRLIAGLEQNLGASIRIVTAPFIAARPGKPRFVPGFQWRHAGLMKDGTSGNDVSVPFLNVFGLRNVARELALSRPLSQALSEALEEDPAPAVIAYSMHGPFLKRLARIKRRHPTVTTCCVVPDLPEHMRDLSKASRFVRFLKFIDSRRISSCLELVDKFVLISEHQAEILHLSADRFVTVEGMVDPSEVKQSNAALDPSYFTVAYTGTLMTRYGIVDLVDSLDHLADPKLRLVICGDGDAASYVEQKANRDERLHYLGRVDHAAAMEIQRRADVLINPRPGVEKFTRYSFPSKTLEYLAAGKPMIAYLNEGIPSEYVKYIVEIEGAGPSGIAAAIESAMAFTPLEREKLGFEAQSFVLREKMSAVQAARVLKLIDISR